MGCRLSWPNVNGDYFKESKIYNILFDSICYFLVFMYSALSYNVENGPKKKPNYYWVGVTKLFSSNSMY